MAVKRKCTKCKTPFYPANPKVKICSVCSGEYDKAQEASRDRDAAAMALQQKAYSEVPQTVDPRSGENPNHAAIIEKMTGGGEGTVVDGHD